MLHLLVAFFVIPPAVKPTTVAEFLTRPKSKEAAKLDGPAFVDYINQQQSFFKAEYSPDAEEFVRRRIMDAKFAVDPDRKEPKDLLASSGLKVDLPERFDAREKWPKCVSLKYVRDQSGCGSCWAVSTVSVMSDRACVLSNGRVNRILSDAEVLSCCMGNCGFGCHGGWVGRSFGYAWRHGISTGGRYREKNACKPYPFYPCGKHQHLPYYGECPNGLWPTPRCRRTCQLGYPIPFDKDKIYSEFPFGKNCNLLNILNPKFRAFYRHCST
ncbi:papain family cysteine protease, partial [Ancylostoma caninum]